MARFRVRGLTPDGTVHNETVYAESLAQAVSQVEAQGRRVQSIEDGDSVRSYEPVTAAPPAAPREIPPGVKGAPGGFVMALVGAIFAGVATVLIAVGLGLLISGNDGGWFMTLFPMIHFVVGVSLLVYAWRAREKRRGLYRDGVATVAVVDRVGHATSVRINGRHPFEIGWTFYVGDQVWHDKRQSMNRALATFVEGDRIWVLYDPANPDNSVEWPPT